MVAEKIRNGKNDGVEFLFLSKTVEGCLISQETLSELLDFDIFCIDWQEFNRDPKCTVGNFGKVNSMSFVVQEPLIQVLGDILATLEAARDAEIELRTRIYLPYSSEVHVEYAKNVGILEEEILGGSKRISLKRFDFASILTGVRGEFEGLDISIETESWTSIFYCNASLVCGNTWTSVYATCVGNGDVLTPILEDEVEGIYNAVLTERKSLSLSDKYVMPTLFSKEGAKSDLGLLKLDNLPLGLRRSYSKHALQLMSFVQQVIGHSFVESESCVLNFLSMGPTSDIISKTMQESYREMLRAGSNTRAQVTNSKKDQVTLLIMDRSLDCISPIYSPILNMNLAEDGDFSRFDDGILEFLDEYMLNSAQIPVLDDSSEAGDGGKREEGTATPLLDSGAEGHPGGEEPGSSGGFQESHIIHEITNPIYLSIMLDPEKLQKDLIISQSYPILSYRFISALEDLQGLISSGERSFPGPLKKDIINRIDSIMDISPVYGHQSWMFLLLSLNQSQYTRRFWSEVSEACASHREEPGRKRVAVLSIIHKYLIVIQGDIISNLNDLNMKSPSTQTSSSSLSPKTCRDQSEKEEVVIGKLVSILLRVREMLLPDSIMNISKKLEDLSLSHPSFCDTQDLRLDLSSLLKILHYFLIPMFPLDVESFHSIFVCKLRKKFTSSSFEGISTTKDQEGLQAHSTLCIRKILALAISCSSYEGPDCKLTSFGLKQVIEDLQSEGLSGFGDLGILGQRLNSIRNARGPIKCKSFRNFQLSPFLPEKTPFKQELQTISLVSQVSLHILQTLLAEGNWKIPKERRLEADLKASSVVSSTSKESDLQSLRNRLKETRKTLIIHIVGSISTSEVCEIERISKQYSEHIRVVILTDHLSSATSITNSLIATQL